MLWTAKGLINIHPPGAPVPKLAVASDKEEWEDAARSLFSRRIYSEAMLGFEVDKEIFPLLAEAVSYVVPEAFDPRVMNAPVKTVRRIEGGV